MFFKKKIRSICDEFFRPFGLFGKAETFEDALQWEVKQIEKSLGEGGLLGSMACWDWPGQVAEKY